MSDDQVPDLSTGRPACNLGRTCRLGQRRACLDKERSARVRKEDATARPMEEGNAKIAFERTNLLTQRWLRDVKALRGSTEVTLFRDGDEVSEVSELHIVCGPEADASAAGLHPLDRLHEGTVGFVVGVA